MSIKHRRCNLRNEHIKRMANSADNLAFMLRSFEIDVVFDQFGGKFFDRALELGCGSERTSITLAKYCSHLVATDITTERFIQTSKKELSHNVTFMTANAGNLDEFQDEQFDLVFSSNLLEHLSNSAGRCLQECNRVVKKGRLIIHIVPNRTWLVAHSSLTNSLSYACEEVL